MFCQHQVDELVCGKPGWPWRGRICSPGNPAAETCSALDKQPELAQPSPALPTHGYRVRDIVTYDACVIARVIESFEGDTQVHAVFANQYSASIEELVPVHRCHTVDKEREWWLPNPAGAPGEPFLAVSECPLPKGTWAKLRPRKMLPGPGGNVPLAQPAYELYLVGRDARTLKTLYACHLIAELVSADQVVESRLPADAIVCECGQAYVLPKEEEEEER